VHLATFEKKEDSRDVDLVAFHKYFKVLEIQVLEIL
jgi:hypothetical protein